MCVLWVTQRLARAQHCRLARMGGVNLGTRSSERNAKGPRSPGCVLDVGHAPPWGEARWRSHLVAVTSLVTPTRKRGVRPACVRRAAKESAAMYGGGAGSRNRDFPRHKTEASRRFAQSSRRVRCSRNGPVERWWNPSNSVESGSSGRQVGDYRRSGSGGWWSTTRGHFDHTTNPIERPSAKNATARSLDALPPCRLGRRGS
jgi:hypothetical protein